MKAFTLLSAAGLFAVSTLVLAAGSEVKESAIINAANVTNAANLAIGKGSEANLGTVKIEGSKVEKSAVINASNVSNAANLAIGKDSEANMGSVVIK
jgi:hypothetical protein